MTIVAIIPAGGVGRRMQNHASKQYLDLSGLPILVYTLRRFQLSPTIDAVYLIVPSNDIDVVRSTIVDRYGLTKVVKILPGGKERQDSVHKGIDALDDGVDIVLIHDGVRPFIAETLIRETVQKAVRNGAATAAVPAKETVKICGEEKRVVYTPNRDQVWLTQTPQAFRREIIVQSYQAAYRDGFYGTDDAVLVERSGFDVTVVPGSYDNIKITTPDDLILAEYLLKKEEWSS
jgi:2-C-methyl-D-erythritol 4-phosphate cytidylyltransferase